MFFKTIILGVLVAAAATVFVSPAGAACASGPIVLDAGHGGWDSGAVGPSGFTEKVANLDIARRARHLFVAAGYPVVLTRDSDISPNTPARDLTGDGDADIGDDLQARVNIANAAKGQVFVSVHNNASVASGAGGTETYYWSGAASDSQSAKLATALQQEIVAQVGLNSRGVLGANFYVLRLTNMPAALIEGAFISNPTEEALLRTSSFRQKLALGIFNGVKKHVGAPVVAESKILKFTLKRDNRVVVDINRYLCEKSFGARVIADVPVISERMVYFGGERSGAAGSSGARGASRSWYFAEGSTKPGFETWLLLSNPTQRSTTARITYMTEVGVRDGGKVSLPPLSRKSIAVNQALTGRALGIKVTSTEKIAAERSVYFKYGQFAGGYTSVGVIAPARQWYFADGGTKGDDETWLSLLNPGLESAEVRVTYMTDAGPVDGGTVVVPPRRRGSVSPNGLVLESDFAIILKSSKPVAAERVDYFNRNGIKGGSVTGGARSPMKRWYFAEGDTRAGRTEYLTFFNPQTVPAQVTVRYMLGKGETVTRNKTVSPGARLQVRVNDTSEVGPARRVAARIDSTVPILAERRMLYDFSGYSGGEASIGSPSASKQWYFAEGFTGGGFSTRLIIANPGGVTANVKVRFLK